jgi:pyridoxal phosphate enzyme (YggS family)
LECFSAIRSDMTSTIAERIAEVRSTIADASKRSGRQADEVRLIAVTKTHPAELVAEAFAAGVRDMGENRVQEAVEKIGLLPEQRPETRWHLIGHLQRNKAKQAVANFDMIHSVDSLRLAQSLQQQMENNLQPRRERLPILLQINVSGEESKEGFELFGGAKSPDFSSFLGELEQILQLPLLDVQGLMTIAPWSLSVEDTRPIFACLRELRDELRQRYPQHSWAELSMGMTNDFAVAIEEGASLVRVGRAIFGER